MKAVQKLAIVFRNKFAQDEQLASLLSNLRAAAHVHQTHHWQTNGDTYYADHLLFERIYGESQEFIDGLAERAVGMFSEDQVNALRQISSMHEFIQQVYNEISGNSPEDMVNRSLLIEKKILENIKTLIDKLESSGELSHGLSNLLEGIADKHESFIYLLGQRNS